MKLPLLILVLLPVSTIAVEPPAKKSAFELRLAETKPAKGLTKVKVGERTLYLHKAAILNAQDVVLAKVRKSQFGGFFDIEIELTKGGGLRLEKASAKHIDKPLAIVVGGKVITAPVIKAKISRRAVITGRFSKAEAERYAATIRGK